MLQEFLGRFKEAKGRDAQFITQLDLYKLNNLLLPLYIVFLCLNFLDICSTLLAMHYISSFRELNPVVAVLFSLRPHGFLIATLFKYLPAIPLFYFVFSRDSSGKYSFEIRLIKFTALVVLVASDILLTYVVGVNNIPILIKANLLTPSSMWITDSQSY